MIRPKLMRLGYRSLPAGFLVAVALAVPALAQQTSTYNTTCDKPPSASDQDAAHASFILGKKAYDESDYGKAIDYLKDAYRLDCTKPELLNYVASAYIAKGDKAEAVAALEAYVKRNPKAPDIESVQRKIANLKSQLGSPGATTATAPTTSTTTTATAPTTSATTTATAAPTGTDAPPPPETTERQHTVVPWIVVGVGGAAVVAGAILLAVGSAKVGDSFALCPNGTCKLPADTAKAQQANNEGRGLQNAGIVVGLVGVAAVGGGLLWHFLEPTGPAKSAAIRPELGPGWAGVSGSF